MIIAAARPAMGKTTWARRAAQHAALREHLPVAVFSLETNGEQLVSECCLRRKIHQATL